MALVRWQPRDAFNFGCEMDSFFGDVCSPANTAQATSTWYPSVDISESDEAVVVAAEIPGIRAEDIKVTVVDRVLTIEGEKKEEKREDQKQTHRVERTYGSFRRAFRLASAVDADQISASYRDGVLNLSLPKAEAAKPRQIEIETS